MIPKTLIEEDLESLINEKVLHEAFEKSQTVIKIFASMEDLKSPQEDESDQPIVIILEDLNEKEMNDPRFQAMFKRSTHNKISNFIINQDYY